MAKFGEGDGRWIVKERADGANCNNWHWTTKDVSSHVKEALNAAVKGDIFPTDGPLKHVRIKSAETTGEASINNRKNRTFIMYELEMKLKWTGELVDGDGQTLESSSGSMTVQDVSAESLDDLEVEFETKSRGSKLSEAVRKQGVECVKAAVQATIKRLQDEVTANANIKAEKSVVTPSVSVPAPQPIKVEAVAPTPPPIPSTSNASAKPSPAPSARRPYHKSRLAAVLRACTAV